MKQWSKEKPLKTYLSRKPWDPKPWQETAFRYLLTGNESLDPPIVARMKAQKDYWPGYLTTLATIYDWIYNSPNFTAEDKRLIEDKLVSWRRAAIRKGEQYQDMGSHFGYGPVTDLAAVGLALHGHRDEAEEFLAFAGGYLWVVMFAERGGVGSESRYRVQAEGSTRHLILGLGKNVPVTISLHRLNGGLQQTMKMTSSAEGTLLFSTPGPTEVEIAPGR